MSTDTTLRVLVVDDEKDICTLVAMSLLRMGIPSDTAGSVAEAKALLAQNRYALCLTDMRLPDGEGIELVRFVQTLPNALPIAVITAHANMDNAINAMKAGAFDYLAKPIARTQLSELIRSGLAIAHNLAHPPQKGLGPGATKNHGLDDTLIGDTEPMRALKAMVEKFGRSNAPVFIQGESGTGKELVARAVHRLSARADGPFVAVNCGAIPESLTESEFFGYRKGSFTGATGDRDGLFQAAHGGSLFLDEVADLPLPMQVKLLRAIQEKSIRKVGDTKEIPVDVRIISATHHMLKTRVEQALFRQDLYYRLNVLEVFVPPLRERVSDIPLIARAVLSKLYPNIVLTDEAMLVLQNYPFPGNVRELENCLERAGALCQNNLIVSEDLLLINKTQTKRTINEWIELLHLKISDKNESVTSDFVINIIKNMD